MVQPAREPSRDSQRDVARLSTAAANALLRATGFDIKVTSILQLEYKLAKDRTLLRPSAVAISHTLTSLTHETSHVLVRNRLTTLSVRRRLCLVAEVAHSDWGYPLERPTQTISLSGVARSRARRFGSVGVVV